MQYLRGSSVADIKYSEGEICEIVRRNIISAGIWDALDESRKRSHLISPEPFNLTQSQVAELKLLGNALLAFYSAANDLYIRSDCDWVNEYIDLGKPDELIRQAKMNYSKRQLPGIIRPDILITQDGFKITELDSVPGGFGHLDCLSAAYEEAGFRLIGSPRGIRNAFADMLKQASGKDNPNCAILVSDESADYLPEMAYLSEELRKIGLNSRTIRPKDIIFTEDGLFVKNGNEQCRIDILYRFYELFDLINIPKQELISYAAKKKLVIVTPPYKHHLEEKLLLALFHLEALKDYWLEALGEECFFLLEKAIVPTYILDNRPVPPHAQISGFRWRGRPIRNWEEIKKATQKERRLVIKPSGFSPLAWGARGVKVGHDMPEDEWAAAVENALAGFQKTPWVLQPFWDTSLIGVKYYNDADGSIEQMQARVRLCPYYFVINNEAELAGVLATACPKDKKLIHGMADAVMAPCRIFESQEK